MVAYMKINIPKRNVIVIIFLSLIAILIIYLAKSSSIEVTTLRLQNLEKSEKIGTYLETDTLEYLVFLKQVASKESTVIDRYGKSIAIKEIIDNNVLIVRFSEDDCSSCLNEELKFLHERLSDIKYKTFFLGTVEFNPKIKSVVEDKFKNSNIYYINLKDYNFKKADLYNRPYYLLCDKNLVVLKALFPLNDLPEKRNNFYNFLSRLNVN